ncbi:hypothetical protein Q0Z83_015540 [Actinoplanes sichuanensis]|uniref:Uncharacterized protein n=1 Tax=Actinoplanes sichuanensis TaxID=512349 RepID=A0ABW4A7T5_9ACTN|nr:hypothetical protein [Actinoplanes sichuanensis]BEL03363.1 hypothetical protein Q0Z83_015540 [Actinoplanes sichuanensis]
MVSGSRLYVIVWLTLVTVLAMLSAATPPRMLTFGMLALGPALAAVSAGPGAVLAIGASRRSSAATSAGSCRRNDVTCSTVHWPSWPPVGGCTSTRSGGSVATAAR